MKKTVRKKAEVQKQLLLDDLKNLYSIGLKDLSSSNNVNHVAFLNYVGFIKGTLNQRIIQGITAKHEEIVQEFFKDGNDIYFNSLMIGYINELAANENIAEEQDKLKDYMDPIFKLIGEKLFIQEAYDTLLNKYDFKE